MALTVERWAIVRSRREAFCPWVSHRWWPNVSRGGRNRPFMRQKATDENTATNLAGWDSYPSTGPLQARPGQRGRRHHRCGRGSLPRRRTGVSARRVPPRRHPTQPCLGPPTPRPARGRPGAAAPRGRADLRRPAGCRRTSRPPGDRRTRAAATRRRHAHGSLNGALSHEPEEGRLRPARRCGACVCSHDRAQ